MKIVPRADIYFPILDHLYQTALLNYRWLYKKIYVFGSVTALQYHVKHIGVQCHFKCILQSYCTAVLCYAYRCAVSCWMYMAALLHSSIMLNISVLQSHVEHFRQCHVTRIWQCYGTALSCQSIGAAVSCCTYLAMLLRCSIILNWYDKRLSFSLLVLVTLYSRLNMWFSRYST